MAASAAMVGFEAVLFVSEIPYTVKRRSSISHLVSTVIDKGFLVDKDLSSLRQLIAMTQLASNVTAMYTENYWAISNFVIYQGTVELLSGKAQSFTRR